MRVKELHPFCCTRLDTKFDENAFELAPCGSESCSGSRIFAGMLYKWTNYGSGWRSRWFLLRNGVVSYSKIVLPDALAVGDDVRFIGDVKCMDNCGTSRRCKRPKAGGIVQLKVSSFRESRSDESKFYIFTATKTLHLRTSSKKEREAWIEALASTKNLLSLRQLDDKPSITVPTDISLSTEKLKKRLLEEGTSQVLVKDCEQIMLLEFSEIQGQIEVLCEERSDLLENVRQIEAANTEVKASSVPEGEYHLTEEGFSVLGRGEYTEWSTIELPDDDEKLELQEGSEDEEIYFFDTQDCFPELKAQPVVMAECEFERRKKLPDPAEKEKGVSLWSLIKGNIGKDLTQVCLPVYFNEPISSLQKCCEDLEYSYLLDRAYHYGKEGNSLQRILNVAAFAVSAYASSEGRHCKPFNPLLGETYEADYPERGFRFFSEKVSHHPTIIACHSEGKGWKFWGDTNIRTKFWGRSIQLDPVGVLTLEFDDGEVFEWSKVTTSIYNLIFGKPYCDHHGIMHIRGNREYSCQLKFKEQSLLEKFPRQVHGFVEDVSRKKHATLFGKWDDSIYYIDGDANTKLKDTSDANLLWRRSVHPTNLTRYSLTSFAITLNEFTPGLQEKLPPTDSRLRPDQRHLENGEYDLANTEKLRLETRQRMSRKLQENGWNPRWFQKDSESDTYRYLGGYWEKREERNWYGCPDIFSGLSQEINDSTSRP